MSDSRISGLHKLDIAARLDKLQETGWLSAEDVALLKQGQQVLRPFGADKMVENVIGVLGLPLAIAPNFIVNGREYVVPMAVEEPSVVAAVSNAAKLARPGGFTVHSDEWLVAGQIHVTEIIDADAALQSLIGQKQPLLDAANAVHPGLAKHGGGVRDLEFRTIAVANATAVAVHVLVESGDAMGANIVNTICESLAPRVAEICGGNVALRILSNLADRSIVHATVSYSPESLSTGDYSGEEVRDRIIMASDIAVADPYRATTHNKGIMNGVDAVAIATGNDWRAIEAGAHAYAAMSGQYGPLATWSAAADGSLQGELEMPLRVATVGGTLHVNTAARLALRLIASESSQELGQLMAAVGLAQNFAAIKALATEGIQKGHMRMHARSAATEQSSRTALHDNPDGIAAGKVILLGEHAAVYGKHALALPIPSVVSAEVTEQDETGSGYVNNLLRFIKQYLSLAEHSFGVDVRSSIPPGMGLGASAAIAVAMIRAINRQRELEMDDSAVNAAAFECEKIAHGNPSGIDNSIATFGVPMLFSNAGELSIEQLQVKQRAPVVIAFSSQRGSTLDQVAAVRARYDIHQIHYAAIFAEIDALSVSAASALTAGNFQELGALMNICHGLLNAIEISTPELESMVGLARSAGASGAKLTGSGGGGSVVALCPGTEERVAAAFAAAGYATLMLKNLEKT
ncbi:MAG: hydroxymethylglutaryl-CoA reductase, degradative [Woeseiaceae bacterium]